MRTLLAAASTLALLFFAAPAWAQGTGQARDFPLIDRDLLFGNPERTSPQLSPDGARLAYLAPRDGVLNVYVAPVNDLAAARPVTDDDTRGVRRYFWAYDNQHILYLQDVGGDEDWQLFSVDIDTLETRNLTPFDSIPGPDGEPMRGPDGKKLRPTAQINRVSHKHPREFLIGLNNRNPQFHDLYRVNLKTGELTLEQENSGMMDGGFVAGFLADDDYNVRLVQLMNPGGGATVKKAEGERWTTIAEIPADDGLTTAPVEFGMQKDILYMLDSRGRDKAALVSLNIETGEKAVIAESEKADIGGVMMHPTENRPQAVSVTYRRQRWQVLDPDIRPDFAYLRTVDDGEFDVVSRTLEDDQWIVAYSQDDGPTRYYRYDRDDRRAEFLFTNRPELESLPLARMHNVVIEARDGLELVSYLTLPVWSDADGDARPDDGALPMVLLVHGGPWGRDSWGYNALHQLLANRGYAALSVNFRGSTGFGKSFVNAGDREWAGAMHDDLIDGVKWAIERGVADPDRVGVMGGSYGGYATLVGLTWTPETFACGVDIVGPSNLITLMNSIPPYWRPIVEMFKKRVGDWTTPEGKEFLMSRSPITRVDEIEDPLLIGQGANDPRVKQAESDQIVQAMQKKNIPVTYVLYPDEGHGFARPENRLSFFAITEAFLHEHLGGRYQPIDDAFEDSSVTIPAGAELIPGVAEAPPKSE